MICEYQPLNSSSDVTLNYVVWLWRDTFAWRYRLVRFGLSEHALLGAFRNSRWLLFKQSGTHNYI